LTEPPCCHFSETGASQIANAHDFASWRAIACATDAAWRIEELHAESELPVERFNARSCLIHEHDWPPVLCQPFGRSLLIIPAETAPGIRRELYVIGRIRIYEVAAIDGDRFNINAGERPVCEDVTVGR
jgi:hypothetical protein